MNDEIHPKSQERIVRGDAEDLVELQQLLKGPHSILHEGASQYQEVLMLESNNVRMYLNQQLQFSSLDERIYHEALVHPAMLIGSTHDRVLIIGGNDGLVLREVLKYPDVKRVCNAGISPELIEIVQELPEIVAFNEGAFSDKRVHIHESDLEEFLTHEDHDFYNIIIIDFPDSANEEISSLYTTELFTSLSSKLANNGIMVCQAHSPKDAPLVFWSIGKTLESAGLKTLSYHVNVPTFGDWGFHLAAKKTLVWEGAKVSVPHQTLPEDLSPWFNFSENSLSVRRQAAVNSSDHLILHEYYAKSVLSGTKPRTIIENGKIIHVHGHEKHSSHRREHHHADQPRVDGDAQDLIELQQLLAGPHRILHRGTIEDHDILILEANDVRMYLDKQLQFSSLDERVYHEALVHPALALVPKRNRILIVGGGDGLAMREVLKYSDVEHVDLVDLDPEVLHVAGNLSQVVSLNGSAFTDKRVRIHQQDAQEFLAGQSKQYNVIIVDFPDPADQQISYLYTMEFFHTMAKHITSDGILVCQSHSPEDAPTVYWSIGKTLESAGLKTLSYHINVPSFGDWGFHLAGNELLNWNKNKITVPNQALPKDLSSLFTFSVEVTSFREHAQVNSLDNLILHEIYNKEVGYV